MTGEDVRAIITWGEAYRPKWDDSPQRYRDAGLVPWGKSRRLGALRLGSLKGYVGVQHIDPTLPDWGFVEEPQSRFFVSMFQQGQSVGLRTFPTVNLALQALAGFVSGAAGRS
jgi:hypothetical protein